MLLRQNNANFSVFFFTTGGMEQDKNSYCVKDDTTIGIVFISQYQP